MSDRLFGHSGRPHGLRLHRGVRAVLEDDVGLPEGATDTGLRRGGRQLWIGPENEAAYLVSLDDEVKPSSGGAHHDPGEDLDARPRDARA